jgi:hypothetical protein
MFFLALFLRSSINETPSSETGQCYSWYLKINIILIYKEDNMINAKYLSAVFFAVFFLFFVLASGSSAEAPKRATSPAAKQVAEPVVPPKMTQAARVVLKQKEPVQIQVTALKIPDLVLVSFMPNKMSAARGEDIKFTTKVTNASEYPSGACTLRLTFTWKSTNPMSSPLPYPYNFAIPALAAGESVTQEVNFHFNMSGYWTAGSFADSDMIIGETNENNNTKGSPWPLNIH